MKTNRKILERMRELEKLRIPFETDNVSYIKLIRSGHTLKFSD